VNDDLPPWSEHLLAPLDEEASAYALTRPLVLAKQGDQLVRTAKYRETATDNFTEVGEWRHVVAPTLPLEVDEHPALREDLLWTQLRDLTPTEPDEEAEPEEDAFDAWLRSFPEVVPSFVWDGAWVRVADLRGPEQRCGVRLEVPASLEVAVERTDDGYVLRLGRGTPDATVCPSTAWT
jgi:hypothetical protein